MTKDQEIERIKKDFKDQWPQLEHYPDIQKALDSKDPIRLAEVASEFAPGYWPITSAARRKTHPIVVVIKGVGLDFEDVERAKEYIARYKAANPADRVSTYERGKRDGIKPITV